MEILLSLGDKFVLGIEERDALDRLSDAEGRRSAACAIQGIAGRDGKR
jgi:hypothetical protein